MSEENIKDFINDVSDGELSAANDKFEKIMNFQKSSGAYACLLYTSRSPRD